MKYAVVVTMDLDIELLDNEKASEVEKKTEDFVRIAIETRGGGRAGIKMIRTKLLGLSKDMP